MLSFDSSLSNALKNSNTTAFWVLKLYYNDESSFIGVSDIDRADGSDFYYGLVASWGSLTQSLDFFNFNTAISNMTVNLINTERSIKGKRFSDLLSTNNFGNRKWELFLNTSQAGTFDTSARMIGTGVISGDIEYGYSSIKFTLLDLNAKHNKNIPSSIVTSSSYPNAPEKNINKPIPMAYGDFYEKDNIGTIPTGNFDRFKHFYKSAFPAIVTDKFDIGEQAVEAHVDSQSMHTLDSENIYYYKSGSYATVTGTTDATTNNPRIEFTGSRCKAYFPLSTSGFTTSGTGTHINEANISNGSFDISNITTISCNSGNNVTVTYAIPQSSKLGEYVGITALTKFGNVTLNGSPASLLGLNVFKVGDIAYTPSGAVTTNAELTNNIASIFSGGTDAWNFEGTLDYTLSAGAGTGDLEVEVLESGIVVEFDLDDIETHTFEELYEENVTYSYSVENQWDREVEYITETVTKARTKTANTPAEVEHVYVSGKGRKYGSWIDADSRNNGYNQNDLIENPVYIIEDILRTELSLTSSDIDYSLFDISGDSSSGTIKEIYNDSVSDIKFAFSQYKFINSRDLINRISKQILSWVWFSGDGKVKIKTLLRPSDTFTVQKTIDFNNINLKSISKTKLNTVRNDITVNYNYDYAQNQNISEVNTTDSTSAGTTVDGNNKTLKLNLDAESIIDETTATQLANAYKTIFKDRKIILKFDIPTPQYNDLEIADYITFSNWDDNLKLYGTAFNSDVFLITKISKKVNGCSIEAIKVDA
jgi:hypothetical protein